VSADHSEPARTSPSQRRRHRPTAIWPCARRPRPGCDVIQEWWGLTDHIADVTDRLAQAGFVALAPTSSAGRSRTIPSQALQMMSELPTVSRCLLPGEE